MENENFVVSCNGENLDQLPSSGLSKKKVGANSKTAKSPKEQQPHLPGHPKVYLRYTEDGIAVCPYCNTVYHIG